MLIFKRWGKKEDGADDGVDPARYTKASREKIWEDAKRAFLQNEKRPLGTGAIGEPVSTPYKNSKRLDLLEMNARDDRNPDVHLVGGYYVSMGIRPTVSMFAFPSWEYKIRKHDETESLAIDRKILPAIRKIIEMADEQERIDREIREKEHEEKEDGE